MKIKKLTAYLLMSGMILGTMSSDLYTIKAQAVETIEETEDKTPENETLRYRKLLNSRRQNQRMKRCRKQHRREKLNFLQNSFRIR